MAPPSARARERSKLSAPLGGERKGEEKGGAEGDYLVRVLGLRWISPRREHLSSISSSSSSISERERREKGFDAFALIATVWEKFLDRTENS